MKVLLDLDGVLADFVGAACRLHSRPNPYLESESLGNYGIQELLGIPDDLFWKDMGEEFWASLDLLPDAREIVSLLERYHGVKNICILTSPVRTPGCTRGKMRWIEEHFPQFRRSFLIGPAKEFCAHENSILYDDYEQNILRFATAGGAAFLMPAPWNYKHDEQPLAALEDFLGV